MAELLGYDCLPGNDMPPGFTVPWERAVGAGSQPSSFVVLYCDGIDERNDYAYHDSYGTYGLVDPMSSLSPAEIEFQQQKEAFLAIPPLLLAQYQDQFVVSHNGEILDHDPDLPALTGRFFAEHEDLPVYIARIGDTIRATIDTPFF